MRERQEQEQRRKGRKREQRSKRKDKEKRLWHGSVWELMQGFQLNPWYHKTCLFLSECKGLKIAKGRLRLR